MDERLRRVIDDALHGDLRPQFNPHAAAGLAILPADLKVIEPILLDRLFQLSRPIADASAGATPDMRLQDAGRFFYLIETLGRLGYPRVQEMLLVVLDEFSQLTEKSYDELYLWCIVQLSRTDLRHVRTFWPQAIALDLRYRSAPWQRPDGTRLFEQPYRFTDLVFYFYVISTLHGRNGRPFPSLALCLKEIAAEWSPRETALLRAALKDLTKEEGRPAFSDALRYFNFKL
jgi:hypothetical protein